MQTQQVPDGTVPETPVDEQRPPRPSWYRRLVVLVPLGLLALLALGYGADLALAGDDIPRGTSVSGAAIGGLDRSAAEGVLREEVAPELTRDRDVTAGSVELTAAPVDAGISLDVDATLDAAGGQPLNPLTRLVSLFGGERDVAPVLAVDDAALTAAIEGYAAEVDLEPVEGTITIEGTTAVAVPPVEGQRLDRDAAAQQILAAVRDDDSAVDFAVDQQPARVSADAVQQALDEFAIPALAGPVVATGPDGARAEIPVTTIAAALRFEPGDDGTLVPVLDPAALQTALGDTLTPFTTPPVDAGFTVNGAGVAVVPAVDGRVADVPALATGLLDVLAQPVPREIVVPVITAPAELTTEEARGLGITEQISTFTTYFTNENSGENIRVVAAEVDGAVVPAGETFSLNGFTGPRTEAEGYIESTIIENGEFVQAVGGGISQFATTMFNALFFAGLEDVTHQPHSYYISRYPAGREATVFYDSIDLAWRNDSDTAVYVDTQWEPGAITVSFYGTKHFDIESISGARYNYSEPQTQRKPDDGDCVAQSGSAGFDISVTRVFRPVGGGSVLREEVFNTRYNAVPEIICE
ncbi:MAG: VanW family protein [Geodermatophilaceae bacterium]|nr:VanW family protein [Geodermatophilaceae bacterium]